MDEQQVAEFYDTVGNSYDRSPYFLACDPLYEAEIDRLTAGRRLRRVLELGCGTGKQTAVIAPRVEELVAIDISSSSLRQAEARCARIGIHNVRFLQQSIVDLPGADGSADGIFSYGDVISHLHDAYREVFRESARVLRPGGFLAFEIDGKWELDMLLHHPEERARARAARGRGHLRVWRDIPCKTFTDAELRQDLAEASLGVSGVRGVNILHCLLPERVLMAPAEESGAAWRAISSLCMRADRALGFLPWCYRLASTRLVVAIKR
jgi:ubiquinone/menaquinone biosynthesis C-methylase UbiE